MTLDKLKPFLLALFATLLSGLAAFLASRGFTVSPDLVATGTVALTAVALDAIVEAVRSYRKRKT